jgi:ABC-type cobalamin/Fe3+-siderophores transport system ATPase subunit
MLRSFRVSNEKGLRLAVCDDVPKVMLIAGPNGIGKSTLLHALYRRSGANYDPDTVLPPLYQPPHRAIRRQQVQRRYLGGVIRTLREMFSADSVVGIEGMPVSYPARTPDNVDEAGSTIKHTLGKIENRRQFLLASMVDSHIASKKALDVSRLPDLYQPIRRLTSRLLPHLRFSRVDFRNEDNIRCVFERTDIVRSDELDLDDLSSGEKAIFLLFLPLIEKELTALLGELDPTSVVDQSTSSQGRVFIIDEPEQHLHPELQARILGYIREESSRQNIQFIIATQSPTLLDQAFEEELYVLNPPKAQEDNQLKKVAGSTERLEALKALAGNAYLVTTGRSIVCLEGKRDSATKPTDVRLLEILYPGANQFTFAPVGAKGNVIAAVLGLRENLPQDIGISVLGLVDRDRSSKAPEGIVAWPVCTIENFLLHGQEIALTVAELAPDRAISSDAVQQLIREVAQSRREDEIRLRVMDRLKPRTVRLKGLSVREIEESLRDQLQDVPSMQELEAAIEASAQEVDRMLADGSFTESFQGKELLRELLARLALPNVSIQKFAYALAIHCAKNPAVYALLESTFARLTNAQRLPQTAGTITNQ